MCATLLKEFQQDIEKFVEERLPHFSSATLPKEAKTIHDAVWGSHVFEPWEIAVIDTMIMQRLREVRQTSFAYLTYPAANHSRFEHSLGTVVMADRFCNVLTARSTANETRPTASQRLEVRMAALLHDCGHVFLSHIGEAQLKDDLQVRAYRDASADRDEALKKQLVGCKVHELLSYAIVESDAFTAYFKKLQDHYRGRTPELADVNLHAVAGYIVGHAHYEKQYLADIINGNFDADKLDYFTRDAYFTGLHIDLDIDRLLYATRVMPIDEDWFSALCSLQGAGEVAVERRTIVGPRVPNRLIVRASGVSTLEQILFAKMQLTSSVYHHHKIRCADAMLTSYVDYMTQNIGKVESKDRLRKPVDYMVRSDRDWLYGDHPDKYLAAIAHCLRARTLPKRALVICMRTTNDRDGLLRITKHPEKAAVLRLLRRKILAVLNAHDDKHTLQEHDIIVDFPDSPSLREGSQTPVLVADGIIDVMDNWVPTNNWLNTYFTHKWQARIFCPDTSDGVRLKVAKAAREVFSQTVEIELELDDNAWRLAGLDPAAVEAAY